MSEVLRTTITLELSTNERVYENIEDALRVFQSVKGVESISPKFMRSAKWVTLEIVISASDHRRLQSLYSKLSRLGTQPPFTLWGRSCVLGEMFPAE